MKKIYYCYIQTNLSFFLNLPQYCNILFKGFFFIFFYLFIYLFIFLFINRIQFCKEPL